MTLMKEEAPAWEQADSTSEDPQLRTSAYRYIFQIKFYNVYSNH